MRKQTMKVYHGVPKSITDEHTIFYASFDGNLVPEINKIGVFPSLNATYTSSPIGHKMHSITRLDSNIFNFPSLLNEITVDFWVEIDGAIKDKHGLCTIFEEDGKYISCALTNSESLYCSVFGSVTLSKFQKDNQKFYHIRVSAKSGDYVKIYVNGVLYRNKAYNSSKFTGISIGCYYYLNKPSYTNFNNLGVCDYHISNIDRGDYFPNLPQDFIDGKAIIRPKFGQQQIKGDPMYSQVTTLKVSPNYRYVTTPQSDGTYQIIDYPELSIYGDSNWGSGSKIKIKGLNGEIISGVIDTDTALARVTSNTPSTITLDSVGGLQVGDYFRLYNPNEKTFASSDRTITDINTETKTITFSGASLNTDNFVQGWLLVENTASSSSPLVKTADGITVVGTWSGLGTNEATFTLGTNTSLAGKDLYIEYALTMPYGNSDFPELPYSIERAWGENGVEMKPVSEIVIIDDFKGKISGSTKECPHVAKYVAYPTLRLPSEFVYEYPQDHYTYMKSLDGTAGHVTNRENTNIPQQLFSFNLIEMVERKLGCEIPSRNKVQWLKDNYDSIEVEYTGYGTNPTGNLVKITIFDHSNNSWLKEWLSITTSSPSTKKGAFRGIVNANRIIPNGVLHVLAFTDSTDGVTYSTVSTDYICVNVKLKTDSTFTTLYCENTRAREDKCNPILIQKETKTVKRYLPSKECFVTECLYSKADIYPYGIRSGEELVQSNLIYLTTQGTGSLNPNKSDYYAQCLARLGVSYIESHLYNNDVLKTTNLYGEDSRGKLRYVPVLHLPTNNEDRNLVPSESFDTRYVALKPFLIKKDNTLMLALSIRDIINGKNNLHAEKTYSIPNRPLIK